MFKSFKKAVVNLLDIDIDEVEKLIEEGLSSSEILDQLGITDIDVLACNCCEKFSISEVYKDGQMKTNDGNSEGVLCNFCFGKIEKHLGTDGYDETYPLLAAMNHTKTMDLYRAIKKI